MLSCIFHRNHISHSKAVILSTSSVQPQPSLPCAILQHINLTYIWTYPSPESESESESNDYKTNHPFTPQLLLPIETTLDNVLGKFISNDLIRCKDFVHIDDNLKYIECRRYPLIFGQWGRASISTCRRINFS